MTSFSGLGIGLSFLSGCILMGVAGELYYLLWVKKRIPRLETQDKNTTTSLFCWKKTSLVVNSTSIQEPESNRVEQDLEMGTDNDLLLKGFGEDGVDTELMRLHNLCGPPRFLFTIKEETKDDLDSVDGRSRKSSRTRSLSDLIIAVNNDIDTTPSSFSPMASPPIKPQAFDSFNFQEYNPLFESYTTEAEVLLRLRSSPPPKFKFLRDAEEKLMRRLLEEAEKRNVVNIQDSGVNSTMFNEEKDGYFTSFPEKKRVREPLQQLHLQHSTSSQVLPLASSPSTFNSVDNKSALQIY